jgi:hypothetical protein
LRHTFTFNLKGSPKGARGTQVEVMRGQRRTLERPQVAAVALVPAGSKGGRLMNTIVVTYLSYVCLSVALTVWVAQTLHKNGRIFLVDVFHGNEALADSVNHLLVVGFYLLNLGYATVAIRVAGEVSSPSSAIETLSVKIGLVLLVLGGAHFANLYVLSRFRRRRLLDTAPPPVAPSQMLPS